MLAGKLPKPLSWKQVREIARDDHVQALTKGRASSESSRYRPPIPPVTTITLPASQVRRRWSAILDQVASTQTTVVVTKRGTPVAVIISNARWERFQALEEDSK